MTAYRFIQAEKANHTVYRLCSALSVSRAAFYAWQQGGVSARASEDQRLAVHIRAAHRVSRGTYGSPRLSRELKAEGLAVGRRRVARLMKEAQLAGVPRRRFVTTTNSRHDEEVAPNLVQRDFQASQPNAVWVGDITYVQTARGWLYVAVLLDLHSRKVVGWEAAEHMRTDLCLVALRRAVSVRRPPAGLTHHTDRGCQYASGSYRDELVAHGIRSSMSRPRDCWDNAVAESFFGTLKTELLHRRSWASPGEARAAIADYIHDFYNRTRRHSSLGYVSPVDFEAQSAPRRRRAA